MYLLYLRDEELVAQEFDERAGEVRGTPRLLVDGIGKVALPAVMPTLVSPQAVRLPIRAADLWRLPL